MNGARPVRHEARPKDGIVAPGGREADEIPDEPWLLYDGECPFCAFYVAKSRLEAALGEPLRLIDGREAPALVARLRREGYDLEEGMILALEGRLHHGADAMTAFEDMIADPGPFGRLARGFSSNPGRVRRAYPWLRRLRRAALFAKGKPGFRP